MWDNNSGNFVVLFGKYYNTQIWQNTVLDQPEWTPDRVFVFSELKHTSITIKLNIIFLYLTLTDKEPQKI